MSYIKKNIVHEVSNLNISEIKPDSFWGMHLIIDMEECNYKLINDRKNIYNFSKSLVKKIKMNPYGEPIIEHFATNNPKASGFSLVQLIETSNICAHFAENTNSVYLDIFSCKTFLPEKAIEVSKKFFAPNRINSKIIFRGLK